jgi:hypothetical protein
MATTDQDYQGVDGDWQNAANWSESGYPGPDDTARIMNDNTDLDTNLNQDAATWTPNNPIANLLFAETYLGDVGASGNVLAINGGILTYRSGGTQGWIKGGWDEVFAAPVLTTPNALQIDSRDASADGDINRLYVERGYVTIVAGATVLYCFVLPGANDATLVIAATTTLTNDLHVDSGLVLCSGEVDGIVYVSGGTFRMVNDTADVNKIIQSGGKVEMEKGVISGGSASDPSVIVKGGHFDAHKHGQFGTIANFVAMGEHSLVDFRTGTKAITRTASRKIGNPRILVDDGDTF